MRIITPDQNGADWLSARRGLITASNIKAVNSFLKKGEKRGAETEKRHRYKRQLALERMTGVVTPHYVSPDMDFGTQYESAARAAYMLHTGHEVRRVGFVLHPELDYSGASPDGLIVASRGCVEFKVPRMDNHLDWLEEDQVPEEHQGQCDWVTACTESDWCDFVSYSPPVDDEYADPRVRDPRRPVLPTDLQLFIKRIPRDEKRISALHLGTIHFNAEVDQLVAKLSGKNPASLNQQLRDSIDAE